MAYLTVRHSTLRGPEDRVYALALQRRDDVPAYDLVDEYAPVSRDFVIRFGAGLANTKYGVLPASGSVEMLDDGGAVFDAFQRARRAGYDNKAYRVRVTQTAGPDVLPGRPLAFTMYVLLENQDRAYAPGLERIVTRFQVFDGLGNVKEMPIPPPMLSAGRYEPAHAIHGVTRDILWRGLDDTATMRYGIVWRPEFSDAGVTVPDNLNAYAVARRWEAREEQLHGVCRMLGVRVWRSLYDEWRIQQPCTLRYGAAGDARAHGSRYDSSRPLTVYGWDELAIDAVPAHVVNLDGVPGAMEEGVRSKSTDRIARLEITQKVDFLDYWEGQDCFVVANRVPNGRFRLPSGMSGVPGWEHSPGAFLTAGDLYNAGGSAGGSPVAYMAVLPPGGNYIRRSGGRFAGGAENQIGFQARVALTGFAGSFPVLVQVKLTPDDPNLSPLYLDNLGNWTTVAGHVSFTLASASGGAIGTIHTIRMFSKNDPAATGELTLEILNTHGSGNVYVDAVLLADTRPGTSAGVPVWQSRKEALSVFQRYKAGGVPLPGQTVKGEIPATSGVFVQKTETQEWGQGGIESWRGTSTYPVVLWSDGAATFPDLSSIVAAAWMRDYGEYADSITGTLRGLYPPEAVLESGGRFFLLMSGDLHLCDGTTTGTWAELISSFNPASSLYERADGLPA